MPKKEKGKEAKKEKKEKEPTPKKEVKPKKEKPLNKKQLAAKDAEDKRIAVMVVSFTCF